MIAVDTNVLARFYVDDAGDPEARRQRPVARGVMEGPSIFVPLTVLLEFEWVTRAFYEFAPSDSADVVNHLPGLPNVVVEARANVTAAIDAHVAGLDFADALHLCASSHCASLVTFDDRALHDVPGGSGCRRRSRLRDERKRDPVRQGRGRAHDPAHALRDGAAA